MPLLIDRFQHLGGHAPYCIVASYPGTLVVGAGTARFYMPRPGEIARVDASVGTAPTGSSAIFDVNKNGTTVFTTQGNRPTIAASGFSDLNNVPDVLSFAAGDYFTFDIDQIGSTIAGAALTLALWYW